MEFTSVVGAAVVAAVLGVTLRELKKEYAILLGVCCSAALLIWAILTFTPAVEELRALVEATKLNLEYQEILIKALGISFLTQMAADCCRDSGETAIASRVELCGKITIVVLSLPMFKEILNLAGSMFSM